MRTRGWTTEQDEILKGLCQSKEFISVSEMSKIIGKSQRNIYDRIRFLGIKRQGYYWSEEEDEMIKKLYSIKSMPISLIAEKLNRTERAVLDRAIFLKVKRVECNNDIHQYIINNYGRDGVTAKFISEKFNRPIKTVYRMARELGVASRQEFSQVTTSKIEYIIKNYPTADTIQMSAKLGIPDYTIRAVAYKYNLKKEIKNQNARKYKKKSSSRPTKFRWSKETEDFLLKNHQKMTMKEMAKELGIQYGSVKCKITAMGLNKQNLKIYNVGNLRFKYCTDEEKQLKLEYITMFRGLIVTAKIGDMYR